MTPHMPPASPQQANSTGPLSVNVDSTQSQTSVVNEKARPSVQDKFPSDTKGSVHLGSTIRGKIAKLSSSLKNSSFVKNAKNLLQRASHTTAKADTSGMEEALSVQAGILQNHGRLDLMSRFQQLAGNNYPIPANLQNALKEGQKHPEIAKALMHVLEKAEEIRASKLRELEAGSNLNTNDSSICALITTELIPVCQKALGQGLISQDVFNAFIQMDDFLSATLGCTINTQFIDDPMDLALDSRLEPLYAAVEAGMDYKDMVITIATFGKTPEEAEKIRSSLVTSASIQSAFTGSIDRFIKKFVGSRGTVQTEAEKHLSNQRYTKGKNNDWTKSDWKENKPGVFEWHGGVAIINREGKTEKIEMTEKLDLAALGFSTPESVRDAFTLTHTLIASDTDQKKLTKPLEKNDAKLIPESLRRHLDKDDAKALVQYKAFLEAAIFFKATVTQQVYSAYLKLGN